MGCGLSGPSKTSWAFLFRASFAIDNESLVMPQMDINGTHIVVWAEDVVEEDVV